MPNVTLGDWIYVPGGFGGPDRLERFDPATNQWQALANMPGGRHHLMATAYGDQLYVFGGAEAPGGTATNTVWLYDPAADLWQELAPMPEARSAGAAVTLGDKIYIAGGAGGSEALLEFTPGEGSWRVLRGPTQPREHIGAVVYQDEIWVLGGRWLGVGELATVEIYSPTSNDWRNGPRLNVARAGFAAAIVNNHIMAAGGEVVLSGLETLDSLEILAPESMSWELGPKLLTPVHGVGGAAFEDHFFLLGGSIKAGAIENEGQVQRYGPVP
jgi:hypothetical protein